MKIFSRVPRPAAVLFAVAFGLSFEGCAFFGPPRPQSPLDGPAILSARSEPGIIELNRELIPIHRARVLAEIKDFKAPITSVTLRFTNAPIIIQMHKIKPNLWQAKLGLRQLEQMAVSGRTTRYQARVVATDENGSSSTSQQLVDIAVKAPGIQEGYPLSAPTASGPPAKEGQPGT